MYITNDGGSSWTKNFEPEGLYFNSTGNLDTAQKTIRVNGTAVNGTQNFFTVTVNTTATSLPGQITGTVSS